MQRAKEQATKVKDSRKRAKIQRGKGRRGRLGISALKAKRQDGMQMIEKVRVNLREWGGPNGKVKNASNVINIRRDAYYARTCRLIKS